MPAGGLRLGSHALTPPMREWIWDWEVVVGGGHERLRDSEGGG
jgi:hypothetical protein